MSKINIQWMSAPLYADTGYGKQSRNIVPYIKRNGYDITVRGTTIKGAEFDWVAPDGQKIRHVPNLSDSTHIDDSFMSQTKRIGANCVVSFFDQFVFAPELVRSAVNSGTLWLCYTPIDCDFVPFKVMRTIKECSLIITMSKFGLDRVSQIRGMPPAIHIPHSLDTNVFKSYPRTRNPNKFVVTNVKVNHGERANWPGFFETIKWIVHKTGLTPDQFEAHCHTRPVAPDGADGNPMGYSLPLLAEIYGVGDYVTFPQHWGHDLALSDERLAKEVYCQSDVLYNPCSGEGFGVPIIEAESCGIPAIVMDEIGGQWELVPEDARIPIAYKLMTPNYARRGLIDTEKAADKIIYLYENPSEKRNLGIKAKTMSANYDNAKVLPNWLTVMKKLEETLDKKELLMWGSQKPQAIVR